MPNFTVWLPTSLVRLATTCACFSCCDSGQLQRPASRPDPNRIWAVPPLSSMNGRPEVKSSPAMFKPGMPASVAGVSPKSFGSTFTPYLKKPKRTSRTVVLLSVKSAPEGHAVVAHLGQAAQGDELRTAALPEGLGAVDVVARQL